MLGRTILVVEDAPDVRDYFASTLRDAGHEVVEAGSVHDALLALRAGKPIDAILADYNLGDGSGAELIHQARNERGPLLDALPAVICTAYVYVELPPNVVMLRKPVDPDTLLSALATAFGTAHVA
jgi:CheY-like chemotaxis protein